MGWVGWLVVGIIVLWVMVVTVKWSKFERLLNGWIPKLSLFVPLIGYLLIFNDHTTDYLNFYNLSGVDKADSKITADIKNTTKIKNWTDLFLNIGYYSGTVRLRLLYFGFLLLGAANLLFIWAKPKEFQLGSDIVTYKKNAFDHYTTTEFCEIQKKITKNADEALNNAVNDIEWKSFFIATAAEELASDDLRVGDCVFR